MKSLACIVAVAATALAGPAAAQDSFANRPTIVVTGNGRAVAQPDTFRVDASVRGAESRKTRRFALWPTPRPASSRLGHGWRAFNAAR